MRHRCINRNILECKGSPLYRNMVFAISVLIETYWNVKESKIRQKAFFRIVLIETYWNVKSGEPVNNIKSEKGINRNILECKVRNLTGFSPVNISINRNILECKGVSLTMIVSVALVLIETYWNVKSKISIA